MKYRNHRFNGNNTIDMEIDHPVYGWMPFTASPDDPEEYGRQLFADSQETATAYAAPTPNVTDLLLQLSLARKEQEQLGVTLKGVRYSGDLKNRQALQEAITYMKEAGLREFKVWKDSDKKFHANHPISEVIQGYNMIVARRSHLIATEGWYAEAIIEGTLSDLLEITW